MLSPLHSPDHTVRDWTDNDVQYWLTTQIKMESFVQNFMSFNGSKLLDLDNDTINDLISDELSQEKFISELLKLRNIQKQYDAALIKFNIKSKSLLKICDNLILQKEHYSWLLFAINSMSPIISDIFKNLVPYIPCNKFEKFHQDLTFNMDRIVPIITYHLEKRRIVTGKSQNLLYFTLNTVSWCYNTNIESVISSKCWLESKLLQEILNKFEDAVHVEPNYIVSCGLLMIIASLSAYSTLDIQFNNVLKQLHLSNVMYHFLFKYINYLNEIQISFPFRTILYIDGSTNKQIEWIIKNSNALDAILKEFLFGLNKKCVNDIFNYYPDAWDRSIAINILMDNKEYRKLLIQNDIMLYMKKALVSYQNTNVETARLFKNVCSILMKMTNNVENFKYFYKYFNLKRLVYYNNNKNKIFWYRLNYIRLNCMEGIDCSESSIFAQKIFDNVHDFYYQCISQSVSRFIHNDLIIEIVTYLW